VSPAELASPIFRPVAGRTQGGEAPLRNISTPLEKCVGSSLKILDIVQKIWALSENSSLLLVSQAGYGRASLSWDVLEP